MQLTKKQLCERAVWIGLYGEEVTKARAARILGRSRRTIYNMIEDGRLETYADGMVSIRSMWAYVSGVTA